MSDRRVFVLNDRNRRHVAEQVANLPVDTVIKTGPKTRTLEQNARLHAMFGELEKQAKYLGRKLTAHQWKNLLISGHSVAIGLAADVIPGIEGEWVNVRESSAQMSVARMTSLIEYVHAWGAENGVVFSE